MAAREARHDFFQCVLKEREGDMVALAHHLDDQSETVLMRLLTGSGMEGLGGMEYRAEPRPGLKVIRPMLDVARRDIMVFLQRYGLAWREDQSNRDPSMLRNRVRHHIIPFLEKEGFSAVRASLVRLADIMREEWRQLEKDTEKRIRHCRNRSDSETLNLELVLRLPLATQRRVIRKWLMDMGLPPRKLDWSMIERLRANVNTSDSGRMTLARTRELIWEKGVIRVMGSGKNTTSLLPVIQLKVPGVTILKEAGLEVSVTPAKGYRKTPVQVGHYPSTAFIRRGKGRTPELIVRSRREGDRIQPTGMTGSVALKQLMINEKLPANQRSGVPVFESGGAIVWVSGYRVARSWSVPSKESPSWKVVVRKRG